MLVEEQLNNSHKTAIRRGGPSSPVKWVEKRFQGLWENSKMSLKDMSIRGGFNILDYGSGRGEDAEYMGAEEYDPFWYPHWPDIKYDIIFCTYVLNVVEREERWKILENIDLLANDGCCRYVTVRRDIDILESPIVHNGYSQHYVLEGDMNRCGYQSVYKRKNGFEIYVKSDYGDY